jgi:excisionase family DNA binding protein
MSPLLTIEEAAQQLGVPKGSLKTAAQEHGLLIRMGKALRIDPNSLKELIVKCREKPKEPASTGGKTKGFGSSVIQAAPTVQRALETAALLKTRSQPTSPAKIR